MSCRSLTDQLSKCNSKCSKPTRGFQKSAKLQRRNISWKACGGAQASKHRPCSPNHHRCGNFVTIIHAIITDFGKSACGPCYGGGACLRKFAATGPAGWANLRTKNALETSRSGERIHAKMKICAPPKAYSISLPCTDTAPAARRQRAGSAWNRSKAVKPYLIGLSVSHQRHTHVLSSRVCTL